jgi:O-antigen/teichoic acid export membrane protein
LSLKQKTVSGVLWALLNQFSNQGISFIISIVLARLLMPKDFGLIGMITIFISVGKSLIDSGLTSSLMRKPDADELDFSTIFYTNLAVSVVVYVIVYFSAPFIAAFFREPALVSLARILCLSFIIGAFSSIQNTQLTKKIKFKVLMMVSIPSLIFGGCVGVYMAYKGYGVWSLVGMQLAQSVVSTIQLWIRSKWMPKLVFSMQRLKEHFRFGINLAVSGILEAIFSNLYQIIIGRFFSPALVGYYTRASMLRFLPVTNISNALNKVTYPVFASIQHDDVKLKSAYKKIMQQVIFWVAPILIGMAVVAEPLFRLLFTEKWLPAVPYFQIMCAAGIMYPMHAYNLNILKVKGRSDLYLRLEIIKKIVSVLIAVVSVLQFGIYGLLYSEALWSILGFFINAYYSGRFLNYRAIEQLKDIAPSLLAALVMGVLCFLTLHTLAAFSDIVKLLGTMTIGMVSYYLICHTFKLSSLVEFKQILTQRLRPKTRPQKI